jgi:GT2 family glycosyltransferase
MNYIAVVNTINRDKALVEKCLNALISQKIRPKEILLIDQNEKKLPLSDNIENDPAFVRNNVKYKSVSSARNSIKISPDTEWIFFCDDDGYACDNYSEILNDLINKNPNIEILAGSIIRNDTNEFYSLRHKIGGSLTKFRNTKNLMGSNFVIKVTTFDKLGRFDENFGVGSYWGSHEETDFCWKAYFDRVPMEFFPELKVYHIPPFNESIKKGFSKAYRYGVGKGALVYKWMIRKRKYIVLYEFLEMLVLPFIISILGITKLKPQLAVNNIGVFLGRIYGFIKAIFVNKI